MRLCKPRIVVIFQNYFNCTYQVIYCVFPLKPLNLRTPSFPEIVTFVNVCTLPGSDVCYPKARVPLAVGNDHPAFLGNVC